MRMEIFIYLFCKSIGNRVFTLIIFCNFRKKTEYFVKYLITGFYHQSLYFSLAFPVDFDIPVEIPSYVYIVPPIINE